MAKKHIVMKISFALPEGATHVEAQAYVESAVKEWKGQLEPPNVDSGDGTLTEGDPMFDLDSDSVMVSVSRVW